MCKIQRDEMWPDLFLVLKAIPFVNRISSVELWMLWHKFYPTGKCFPSWQAINLFFRGAVLRGTQCFVPYFGEDICKGFFGNVSSPLALNGSRRRSMLQLYWRIKHLFKTMPTLWILNGLVRFWALYNQEGIPLLMFYYPMPFIVATSTCICQREAGTEAPRE
jgi:hypothetical protein